jgi:hypothetical protein
MSSKAIVARATERGLAFLSRASGPPQWTEADADAQTFNNLREATRAALQLPGRLRAFALPESLCSAQ